MIVYCLMEQQIEYHPPEPVFEEIQEEPIVIPLHMNPLDEALNKMVESQNSLIAAFERFDKSIEEFMIP